MVKKEICDQSLAEFMKEYLSKRELRSSGVLRSD
jgi:hypothetical protein